jgi:hypothetical protein
MTFGGVFVFILLGTATAVLSPEDAWHAFYDLAQSISGAKCSRCDSRYTSECDCFDRGYAERMTEQMLLTAKGMQPAKSEEARAWHERAMALLFRTRANDCDGTTPHTGPFGPGVGEPWLWRHSKCPMTAFTEDSRSVGYIMDQYNKCSTGCDSDPEPAYCAMCTSSMFHNIERAAVRGCKFLPDDITQFCAER